MNVERAWAAVGIAMGRRAPTLDVTIPEGLTTCSLSDGMNRSLSARGLSLVQPPAGRSLPMVGTATTVRTRAGDNLAVLAALEGEGAGRVLVIDAGGRHDNAIVGELLCALATARGFVGVVVDGAVRDREALSGLPLPVFASGASPDGPYKCGPGAVHGPVAVGGRSVQDGDLVVGDADGLVFVTAHDAADAVTRAEQVLRVEEGIRERIQAGDWHPIEAVLSAGGRR